MRLNASKHPKIETKLPRKRRIGGNPAVGALLSVGVLVTGFILPSAAQSPTAPGAKLEPFTQTLPGSVVKIKMVPIPGGTIKIGTKTVTVKPFWMASTETPWEAYDVFTASGPPSPAYDQTDFPADAIARPSKSYILPDLGWGHNGYPVINVSFTSVDMFCRWLASATEKKYRLPTEAEWEWACRAGNTGPWKLDKATLEKSVWYAGNSEGITHPVGKKAPNKFGLHDILGSVGEWATDLDGKPVLCGGTYRDGVAGIIPGMRRRWSPKWQETDPQIPKSRWWLADGKFVGFRLVCEP
jgi:formylglycine-generating enzyme required for sulfatase activity